MDQEVYQILVGTQQPDQALRQSAEQQLATALKSPGKSYLKHLIFSFIY